MSNKIEVSIAGSTGYTAGELLRILIFHPSVAKINALSSSQVGTPIADVHRDLVGDTELCFTDSVGEPDVLFLALGHGLSKEFLDKNPLPERCRVIDLGNDFRLEPHYAGRDFQYGLVDSFRSEVAAAHNIANPGCFATAIETALAPMAKAKLLSEDIHITALTGSTGAGKNPSATTHFSYRTDNVSIYKNFTHQHLGEIALHLGVLMGADVPQINFVPIRGDFARGIFASIYTKYDGVLDEAYELFESYYASSPFVHLSQKAVSMKEVVNTNKCLLHLEYHNGYLHITSVIDNLVKGAAGQAVECMNLMLGFGQRAGLSLKANAF